MKTLFLWIRICRPQTLFASLVPVLVALSIVGVSRGSVAIITVLCALSLQILSNLINDYYDFVRGTDKAGRTGFKRALAEGEVSKSAMLKACIIAAVIACVLGVYLVIVGGWPILVIGLSALLFAWLYTATNHSLSYLGIADLFVFLYYGVVASCGTAYLQMVNLDGILFKEVMVEVFCAGAVSGLVSMCVLMINNLRDVDSDRVNGKRTIPVRFGKKTGEALLFFYVLLMPIFAWLAFHDGSIICIPSLIVIPAFLLGLKIRRSHGTEYNKCLLMAGMLNVVYFFLCLV